MKSNSKSAPDFYKRWPPILRCFFSFLNNNNNNFKKRTALYNKHDEISHNNSEIDEIFFVFK